jgi:hypothetical protein
VAKMWHLRAKIWQKMWQILKCTFFALGWDVAVPIGVAKCGKCKKCGKIIKNVANAIFIM